MPEQYTETIQAQRLRAGDVVDGKFTVASTEVKPKYTYVTMVGESKVGRFENIQPFTVTRTRPTKEEQRVQTLESVLRDLDDEERKARRALATAQAEVIKQAEKGYLSGWAAEGLMGARLRVQCWDKVAHVSKVRAVRDDVEDVPTRVDCVRLVRDEMTRRMLENMRLMSRSTSTASNFQEDAETQGKLEWLDTLRWNIGLLDSIDEN